MIFGMGYGDDTHIPVYKRVDEETFGQDSLVVVLSAKLVQ
jgi:hypothetical protein